jgi:IS30 family transposase
LSFRSEAEESGWTQNPSATIPFSGSDCMAKSYRQLSLAERVVIQTQLQLGLRPAAIAAGLNRARSSITREMARNGWKPSGRSSPQSRRWGNGGYLARTADLRAVGLHRKPRVLRKLVPGSALWQFVLCQLRRHLSPAQIASTLARMPAPVRISHETFYATFYAMPRGELRRQVLRLLPRKRPQRGARSPERHQRAFLDAMTLIDQRPEEVDQRIVPGHWEGDLIKGAMNRSCVGTLVERRTLFVALVRLQDQRAETVANGFASILNRFQSPMRLSLTYDQGRELARHQWLAQQTGMKVYFAHPHCPWERGICENTNGLLRQYMPKGTDLSGLSQQQLDQIAMEMNARPRKTLGWKAPAELFLPQEDFNFVDFYSQTNTITPVALAP